MGKYTIADELLERAVTAGAEEGWDRADMLLAMIVASVQAYKATAGAADAAAALTYELNELGGEVDTQFLRSR